MMTTEKNMLSYREDFPILNKLINGKPLIYFDTAATAQKPRQVIDAMSQFMMHDYGTVHRAIYELSALATDRYSKVRVKLQHFLNAKYSEEIIYTRGTTESINMVAYSFGKAFIQEGDEILISQIEHHSNIVPWQILCEDRKAILKVIPINKRGELNLEAYEHLLSEKTKIVAVGHISNALGTIHPIKKIIEMAHSYGAKVLIDGAQAAPHLKIDVQELDCDFYTFSGHKLYGPTGIGVLYGKKEILEKMPPYQGGGDMIETVTFEKTSYNALPMKFEAGTPMIIEVVGLGEAIDYIESVGLENIENHEKILLNSATEKIQLIPGLKIIGTAQNKSAIISFIVEGVHSLDIGTLLDLYGIAVRTGNVCAQPALACFNTPSITRVSFGLYNTIAEIDQFIVCLKKVIEQLK